MKIPFIGPTYTDRSLNFDAQRTINFYPIKSEVQDSKDIVGLRATPGLLSAYNLDGTTPVAPPTPGGGVAPGDLFIIDVVVPDGNSPPSVLYTFPQAVKIFTGKQFGGITGQPGTAISDTINSSMDPAYFVLAETRTFDTDQHVEWDLTIASGESTAPTMLSGYGGLKTGGGDRGLDRYGDYGGGTFGGGYTTDTTFLNFLAGDKLLFHSVNGANGLTNIRIHLEGVAL